MSDKPKLNLIKEEDFEFPGERIRNYDNIVLVRRRQYIVKANDIIQAWYEKEFKVGYYIEQHPGFIGQTYEDDRDCDRRIIYKTKPLKEKEKCDFDHYTAYEMQKSAIGLIETYAKYHGNKIKIETGKCPKCGEKLSKSESQSE